MNYAKINGVKYPLRFGMLAMTSISKEFGGVQELLDRLTSGDAEISNAALCSFAYALIKNAEAVERFECETVPDRPKLKNSGHIAALLGYLESAQLFTTVQKILETEVATTISVEDDEKNAETTQE